MASWRAKGHTSATSIDVMVGVVDKLDGSAGLEPQRRIRPDLPVDDIGRASCLDNCLDSCLRDGLFGWLLGWLFSCLGDWLGSCKTKDDVLISTAGQGIHAAPTWGCAVLYEVPVHLSIFLALRSLMRIA